MIIVGKTGTGKSTFGRALLPAYEHVVAIDPIGTLGADLKGGCLEGYKLVTSPDDLARAGRFHKLIQYRPHPKFHDWQSYDLVFHWCFERKNHVIYTDEAYRVMRGRNMTEWHNACVTAGRGRGIGMITLTQRPTGIDLRLITEAEHAVCFRLLKVDDRKRMAETMGDIVVTHPARGHEFWYMKDGEERPRYFNLDLKE